MVAFPGGTNGTDGKCSSSPVSIEIARTGVRSENYRGQHSGFEMTCSGITEEATRLSGLRDTVVVFPTGTMSAVVYPDLYYGTPPGYTPPDFIRGGRADITLAGFFLSGRAAEFAMRGELSWFDEAAIVGRRLQGTWNGNRD